MLDQKVVTGRINRADLTILILRHPKEISGLFNSPALCYSVRDFKEVNL
jgi:hypothetical protein